MTFAAAGIAAHTFAARARAARPEAGIRAIALDGFTIIDPRPVAARAEALFPGRGKSLMAAWRMQQFGYAWLRSMGRRYADFWHVTGDALEAAARSLDLPLGTSERDQLMQAWLALEAWPDAAPVLRRLKERGIK